MTLASGTRLGTYEILGPLGAGGMGEVYRARDTRLDRDVAIKILPDIFATDLDRLARFEREAKTVASLNHPHIAQIYGVEETGSTRALVMELVEGDDVAARIARGPIPPDEALPIARQIADALEAAHERGIIHRDLKPANIKIKDDGTVKVLDFGLAKALDTAGQSTAGVNAMNSPTFTGAATQIGVILGTAAYMAPEQAKGKPVDRRADIWAFGCVLYEMLTGQAAFKGETVTDVLAVIVTRDADLSALPASTPPAVRVLIERCLVKDPRQRLRDIGEARIALDTSSSATLSRPASDPASASSRTGQHMLPWLLVTVLTIIVAGVLWTSRVAPPPGRQYLSVPVAGGVLDAGLEYLMMAVSPDGQAIAYCARESGVVRLYLRRLSDRDARLLPGTEEARQPFFSPDGRWIGFFSRDKLKKVSVSGGVPIALADVNTERGGIWLEDDTIVFAPGFATGLFQIPAGGGTMRAVSKLDEARNERTHRWPDALPGGEWVLFTVGTNDRPGAYDDSEIAAVSLKTGERRTVLSGASMVRALAPDRILFARNSVLFSLNLDPVSLKPKGQPEPALDRVAGESTSGAAHFDTSRDGTLAYVATSGGDESDELVWVDRSGAITPLGVESRTYFQPRLSADGRRIVVSAGPAPASGRGDVWVVDIASKRLTRVTLDQASGLAMWTPDQRHIVYYSESPSPGRIMMKPVDGSAPERVIHTPGFPPVFSGFTPDGKGVLFSPYGAAETDVLMAPLDGSGKATAIVGGPARESLAVVSPDGRWLAYVSSQTGPDEIFVRGYGQTAGPWQVSADGGTGPLWSYDGRELFYTRGLELMSVPVQTRDANFVAGTPRKLLDLPPGRRQENDFRAYDVTRDGSRFLITRIAGAQLERRQIHLMLNAFAR